MSHMIIYKQELPDSKWHYEEIDIAKGIGIVCIVASHVYPGILFNQFLFSFHVPLFFLISGFTYRYYGNKNVFYAKKFQRVLVPYLFFSLVSILLLWVMNKVLPMNDDPRILPNIASMIFANSNSFDMTWNSPLWFLPCMFVSLALMDFLESMLRHWRRENCVVCRFVISISLWAVGIFVNTQYSVHLPLHAETALFLTGFSELGYVLSKYRILGNDGHSRTVLERSKLLPVVCLLVLLGSTASCINGWTDVRTHLFGRIPVLMIVTGVCFSFAVLLVSVVIKRSRWLEYLGIHSIAILVMHKFPVMFFKLLIPGIQDALNNSGSISGFFVGVIITVCSIAACLVCEIILLAFFPYALGVSPKTISKKE